MNFYSSRGIWKANKHFHIKRRLDQYDMTNMGLTEILYATNVIVLISAKFTSFTILFHYK